MELTKTEREKISSYIVPDSLIERYKKPEKAIYDIMNLFYNASMLLNSLDNEIKDKCQKIGANVFPDVISYPNEKYKLPCEMRMRKILNQNTEFIFSVNEMVFSNFIGKSQETRDIFAQIKDLKEKK